MCNQSERDWFIILCFHFLSFPIVLATTSIKHHSIDESNQKLQERTRALIRLVIDRRVQLAAINQPSGDNHANVALAKVQEQHFVNQFVHRQPFVQCRVHAGSHNQMVQPRILRCFDCFVD